MATEPKRCEACPQVTSAIQDHHLVPLSYGGKREGQTVAICSSCHTTVHIYIENPELQPPPNLAKIVMVGRRAKELFKLGKLEARDRRPTLLIPMTPADEARLAYIKTKFNTRSRSETMLVALRFAAENVGKVNHHG